tara:strand:- start:67 stop:303 length:237 start_codon:yes stop_codon:yes gene_type:complete
VGRVKLAIAKGNFRPAINKSELPIIFHKGSLPEFEATSASNAKIPPSEIVRASRKVESEIYCTRYFYQLFNIVFHILK